MVRLFAKALNSGTLINMTLTGSVIILFVLIARLCLKRAPKVYSYCLWGVVLFRLLCPVSITAPVSALNIVRPEVTAADNSINLTMYVANVPAASRTITNIAEQTVMDTQSSGTAETQADPMIVATAVWAMGLLAMVGHGFVGFFRLRKKLVGSVEIRQGVYLADGIDTPFVLGILHPQIYLPSGISIEQRPLILAHERYHIHRFDMLWKLLGYMALCLHWFNPLVWVAFVLAGKDMEMSCDEAVLRKLDSAQRADYASALLRLSTGKRTIAGTPLAFGEGDTKGRIKNMAKWKKPKVGVSILCALVCMGIAIAFLTNPRKGNVQGEGNFELLVGSRFVHSIHVKTPKSSGVGQHADNSLYAMGERVYLETIADLDSLAGVTIEAFGEDGVLIWGFSVPENMQDLLSVKDGSWQMLCKSRDDEAFTQLCTGPSGVGFGDMSFNIPSGVNGLFKYEEDRPYGEYSFLIDNEVIGGVRSFKISKKPEEINLDWIYDLPLPEWEMENVGYFADSGEDSICSIEFFSDVPPGVERTLLNSHELYKLDGVIYDLWFDEMHGNDYVRETIRSSFSPSNYIIGYESPEISYEIGPLPVGYSITTEPNGSLTFTQGEITVGGIDVYPIPLNTYDPEDTAFHWLERNGISDFGNPNLYYSGGMTFFPNQWTAYFTGENPKAERHHKFMVGGNYLYDIWLDGLLVDYAAREEILSACKFKIAGQLLDAEHTIHSQSDAEETAYQTIANFLNALQENTAAYIVQDRHPIGASAPSARSSYYYLADGNLYYNEIQMLSDGKNRETAKIVVGREGYYGERTGDTEDWNWTDFRGEYPSPWIGSIGWNRQTFQYIDTLTDDTGTVYLYHSDFWFEEDDGGYFINFYFNTEGQFDHVTIRVNQFMDDDYEVVESILNTDSAAISEWINREYQKAVG